jgi:hypothetical protein
MVYAARSEVFTRKTGVERHLSLILCAFDNINFSKLRGGCGISGETAHE